MHATYRRILDIVKQIPDGKVATYGQIATLAGMPRQARLVGQALARLDDSARVPWHRVVNAKGMISRRSRLNGYEEYQRVLLEEEGITFDQDNCISLQTFQWQLDIKP